MVFHTKIRLPLKFAHARLIYILHGVGIIRMEENNSTKHIYEKF